jgi:uncharacterized repeat protein (TIGR01451 family)
MNRTLSRRHRIVLLPLLAVASLITGLSAPAGAAPTALRAQLDLNTASTIPSGSSAGFTLHWSVNDAPSPKTTIAMTLPTGVSITPTAGTVKLPDACITGSSIATDGRSFVCELGAKDEGTWGALGLTLSFAGSNNDTFPVSYTLSDGTATVTSNPQTITITATPQAELLAGFRPVAAGPTAGSGVYATGLANITDQNGVNGRIVYVPVRIEVPIGGEPVTGATFDLDWSGFKTTWPNTRPVDFPVAPLPGQANCAPWAIPGWGPAGKQGTNGATGADAVIDSGAWSCATTGTTTKVTITGISPSPSQALGGYLAGYNPVANGVFGLFIPASDEPFGTSTGVATVKNIAMTTKSGLTALDQNTPNNDASFSIQRFAPGFTHDGAASWTQDIAYYEARPDSSALTQTIGWLSRWNSSATAGNPNLSPSLTSSLATDYNNRFSFFPNKADNGLGLTNPGATIYATTSNSLTNSGTDHGDYALCTKWDPTITTLVPAPSTVQKIDSTFTNNSAVENQSGNTSSNIATPGVNPAHPYAMATMQEYKELPEGFNLRFNLKSGLVYGRDYIIQYGRIANQSTSDCGDAAALSGWHDDPAAVTGGPVNAVRAVTLGDQFPQIQNQNYRWFLDVPLKVNTALPKGTNVPFWSVRKMLPVQPSNGPALPLDSVWIGEGVYNATNHTGDARYGSRITTTGTALTISKVTEFGDTPVAVKLNQQVDFTIEAVVHGDGTVPLTIEDIVGKGMEYVPGTATITTGPGITAPAGEPTITAPPSYLSSIASSQLNWDFGSIVGVNGQKVTIKYTAKANSDAVAGGTGLNVAIARGGDNENGAASVTPDKPNGAVAFRSFTFSNSYWELNVHKQAGSTPIFPGQDASYSLNYRNDGSKEAGSVTFIDVFPFNGDNNAPELGDNEPGREVGSDFAGTLKLASATGTDETFLYTKAAPTSISLDPLATSNTPVTGTTVWCQPVGGTQPLYGHFGDAGCPANLAEATAVRFTTGAALKPAQARSVQLVFHTTGNAAGDLYTNNYGGRVNPPSSGSAAGTPVLMGISNDVTIKVRALRLGDYVWNDTDHDGIQDAGESPIAGVTVELLDATNTVIGTTTTDAAGKYLFDGLVPGDYKVRFTTPAGFAPTLTTAGSDTTVDSNPTGGVASVTLDGTEVNDENLTIDAGFFPLATLGDFVWNDIDHDGIQDSGEAPVPGVTVTLTNAGGTVATAVTDADGKYLFTNLVPGDYTVTFSDLPAGYVVTTTGAGSDTAVDSNGLVSTKTNLDAGEVDLTYDLGIWQPAALGDFVWHDTNVNGRQDAGEAPVPGVTVTLTDGDGNEVATAVTDADGLYLFDGLVPGDYTVTFSDLPAGYSVTETNAAGTTAANNSNGLVSTKVSLAAGETDLTFDLGIYRPASVGDFVWNDTDHDGIQDAGEDGVPGVTVTLTDGSGNVVATTTTDADGAYLFDDLVPGTYTVTFSDVPAGFTLSPTNAGSNTAVDSNGLTTTVTLTEGQHVPTIDLGIFEVASLGDYVWIDADFDGIQDSGEAPVPGVTVTLTNAGGTVATAVTDADGKYLFTNLVPGDYTVTFSDLPAGYVVTTTGAGSDTAVDSNGLVSTKANLATGESDLTYDLGIFKTISVGDYVWLDADRDGVQDASEAPVPNVTVTLLDANGDELATTTTDADGLYLFDGLTPGDYSIVFSDLPSGLSFTGQNAGGDDDVDSDPDTDGSVSFTLNQDRLDIDAGLVRPLVSIGDYVWFDHNRNGVQDSAENPVEGVTVNLLDANGDQVATTTTDADGFYSFGDLEPSTGYAVEFVAPSGYHFTDQDAGSDNAVDSDANPTTGIALVTTPANGSNSLTNPDDPTIDAGFVRLDLTLTKDLVSSGPFYLGDEVTFELTPHNEGPSDAHSGWSVTDVLPSGLELVSIDGSGYACVAGTLTCTSSSPLAAGEDGEVITVVATITETDTTLTNVAYVTPAPGEVTEDVPLGTPPTSATDTDASTTNNDGSAPVVVSPLVSLGDYTWIDSDRDGVQDSGEAPLPGVTVVLLDSNGDPVAMTTTDADGLYLFTDLVPGDYTVIFTAPAGYNPTTSGAGSDTDVDSDPASDGSVDVDLTTDRRDIDAGFTPPAVSLGNYVWFDDNHDGIQDSSEDPVPGVTVTLTDADGNAVVDNQGNTVAPAVTDADGLYLFSDLPPGDYTVVFSDLPADTAITLTGAGSDTAADSNGLTASTSLPNDGDEDLTLDLGLVRLAGIGDRVWFDIDRNGIQDQGEDNVEGVTVTLTDSDGNVVATAVTDTDGEYLFDGLFPGDYRVTFSDLPAGYQVTTTGAGSDTAVDSNGLTSVKVALAAGETDLTYDLGLWLPASVGDFVWLDANANGIQDQGEAPVPGVTVTLLDADGNELATTTTDADGAYLFDQLVPGDYLVRFTAPNGYVISPTNIGSDSAVDSDGITTAVTLDAGEHDPTIDLGIYRPASLGDFVWLDMDADGIQDQGEAPVPGVTVTLLDADGNELSTTTTDADGAYLFDGLAPGTYTVTFSDLPADHVATTTGAGSDNTVDSNGLTTTVTLAENEHNPTIDLGIYPLAAIGDRVWFDLDRNGIQDDGEESTPGVTVTLLDGDGNEVATATTDADGRYLFDGLRPGDYTVVFSDLPADYEVTTTSAGNNPALDSNGLSSVKVALAAGETDLTYDLGLWLPASVGDFVWLDANADGIQDQGEAPVPGVTVTLLDADGNEVATTTTDADGAYLFDGLVPGDYTVTFTVPDGYVTSPTDAGDDDAADSDGTSVDVNLEPGEHDPTIDLGLYRPASLGDFVWLDADRDGIQDEGEAPVPGVTVTLLDADGNELATTTTDAEGAYLFDGLAPGTYTVTFSDLPAGLVVTTTRVGDDRAIDSNGLTTVDITLAEGEHNPTIDLGLYRPTIDIELVKFVNGDDANEAPGITVDGGSEVTWTYEITNTGEVDLVDLTLVDDIEGDVVCPQNTLAVGETITCTLKGVAIEGPYTNVGTVTGTNVDDPSETVTDDDPANYTGLVDEEPTTTTTTTVPTTPTTQPATPPADVDQNVTQRNPLVTTGADVLALVLIGGALLAAGFLILGARRRRSASGA